MPNTGAQFAFVVGEVAPSFHGRSDLSKYPLGLAECENFLVDYRGGVVNRPGHEFLAAFAEGPFRFARFKAPGDDYVLLFLPGKMHIVRNGGFVLQESVSFTGTDTAGVYSAAGFADGDLVQVVHATHSGVHRVANLAAGAFKIVSAFGDELSGEVTCTKIFALATGISGENLQGCRFTQDDATLVCTNSAMPVRYLTYVSDTSWTVTSGAVSIPTGPTSLTASPSAGGLAGPWQYIVPTTTELLALTGMKDNDRALVSELLQVYRYDKDVPAWKYVETVSAAGKASVRYLVTAVVDGVETQPSPEAALNFVVNFSTTAGYVSLSWPAVTGATHYNVYRSLVFPSSPFPAGAEVGYIGKTTGTTFQDMNITPDFTKTIGADPGYFANSNYPALYARFQQRGVYSGLAKKPLTVVGSLSRKRRLFSTTTPVQATDSYSYEVDAASLRPIKHMIPLRYGLMLFTDDAVYQLYGGGETRALTATSAQVDVQTFTSVSDMEPIVVNLDLMFMSALGTEFNAMVYTEYTNSFKTQDIMVLASHLFGPDNLAVHGEWAAEPHKTINFLRADGQRVSLTYERSQEVYGWARHRTQGMYLDLCTVRENDYNLPYYMVRRYLRGRWVMTLERDKPRRYAYRDQWFVDCGAELAPTAGAFATQLSWLAGVTWELSALGTGTFSRSVGDRVYASGGIFLVEEVDAAKLTLRELAAPTLDKVAGYANYLAAGAWQSSTPVSEITGLWWLDGETVSVLADGDAYVDLVVEDGRISLTNEAGRVVCGLPYVGTIRTLPLGLNGYNVNGKPLALRGVTCRLLNSRGLEIGTSTSDLEEIPAATFSDWGAALEQFTGQFTASFFGGEGWASEASVLIRQRYPLAADVLGLTYELDVGE